MQNLKQKQKTPMITQTTNVYNCNNCEEAFKKAGILPRCKDNKKIRYYNAPAAFDIETSSFIVHSSEEQKVGIMYIWTFCIKDIIVNGRTWDEFITFYKKLVKWYDTSVEDRFVIYVHNLQYEFQFLHKHLEWEDVFALDKREVVRALTIDGIEFRCSYKLSGYSLDNLSSTLINHKIKKLVGDLDYSKIRHTKTPLTKKEYEYTYNDVLVVSAYIQEYIDRVKYIYEIPMTKTGEVRRVVRRNCFYGTGDTKNKDTYHKYRKLMNSLTLRPQEYVELKEAFMGGFAHANAYYVNELLNNVHSMDRTSAYPFHMVADKFPMSKPILRKITSRDQFREYINNYCCFFKIEMWGVQAAVKYENYLSKSHCFELKNITENNGRIVSADHLVTVITEQDFLIIEKLYYWDKMEISSFRTMRKGYLPRDFVTTVLKFYSDKTTLKGVEEKYIEYMLSKERINAMYGMTVTDICRPIITYTPLEWTSEKPLIDEALPKANKSLKRFLFYGWGVWVTAYARFDLFTSIVSLKDDYVYADTDSSKFLNLEKNKEYFTKFNKGVRARLERAANAQDFDINLTRPKTIKGVIKELGTWDYEGMYSKFKTLGAKRYMYIKDGKLDITVSGLNKKVAVPFLIKKYGGKVFDAFTNELYIPAENTGKLTHTYIDDEREGYVTDYLGNKSYYNELSAIHLQPADYTLSLSSSYLLYLLGIIDKEI